MSSDPIGDAALMGGLVGLGWGLIPLFLGMGCDRFILGGLGFAVAIGVGVMMGSSGAFMAAVSFGIVVLIARKK